MLLQRSNPVLKILHILPFVRVLEQLHRVPIDSQHRTLLFATDRGYLERKEAEYLQLVLNLANG